MSLHTADDVSNKWHTAVISIQAGLGSHIPLSLATLASWDSYGVVYQNPNGTLALIQPTQGGNNSIVDSWPTDVELPSITLAPGGSFAAFTTGRPDSRDGLVNTYILYQETSSQISMVYLDNAPKWVIVHPEALSTADNGTELACLTMLMTQKDMNGKELDPEEASIRTHRCYFQRGGYVGEFALSGTDWIELGTIPMY